MRFKQKTIFENWIFDENPITLKHRRCTLRISVNKKGFIISHQSPLLYLYVPIIGSWLTWQSIVTACCGPVPAWLSPLYGGGGRRPLAMLRCTCTAAHCHLSQSQSVVEPVPASWTQLWSNIHWMWWCDLLILKCVHVWLLILNMFFHFHRLHLSLNHYLNWYLSQTKKSNKVN